MLERQGAKLQPDNRIKGLQKDLGETAKGSKPQTVHSSVMVLPLPLTPRSSQSPASAAERAGIGWGRSYFCREMNDVWPLEHDDSVRVKQMLGCRMEARGPPVTTVGGEGGSWFWLAKMWP